MKNGTRILLALSYLVLSACSTTNTNVGDEPAKRQLSDVVAAGDEQVVKNFYDPWEGYNHRMYDFNARFDRYVFVPVVNTYKKVTPRIARKGVSNFFRNLGEVGNFANSLLQFKLSQSARTLGRFAVNSTVGLAGLFDPATHMGLEYQREDFGQTLGSWGVGPGPYFVLPILGPSTLRDAPSVFTRLFFNPIYEPAPWLVDMKDNERLAISALDSIDTRSNIGFRYYESGSPFEYYLIRAFWLEYRQLEVEK